MKLKDWIKPLLKNELPKDDTVLYVRASLDESSTECVWNGNIRDFAAKKPTVDWECHLSGVKIENLAIADAMVDDGEEGSVTVNVKGRKENDLYDTDRVP